MSRAGQQQQQRDLGQQEQCDQWHMFREAAENVLPVARLEACVLWPQETQEQADPWQQEQCDPWYQEGVICGTRRNAIADMPADTEDMPWFSVGKS